jgi:hypothetical protein
MTSDSTLETLEHIRNVQRKMLMMIGHLMERAFNHDKSKLEQPEKEVYDEYTPFLKDLKYGSPEYKDVIAKMKVGVDHHYSVSPHHPEYYRDGINGMNLIDLVEMVCDWKAAGERHLGNPITIVQSIEINAKRFDIDDQLKQILLNTVSYMEWI